LLPEPAIVILGNATLKEAGRSKANTYLPGDKLYEVHFMSSAGIACTKQWMQFQFAMLGDGAAEYFFHLSYFMRPAKTHKLSACRENNREFWAAISVANSKTEA
jgi:hypothetical protein